MAKRLCIPSTKAEVVPFYRPVDRQFVLSPACRKLSQSNTYRWAYELVVLHQSTHLKEESYQQWIITKKDAKFNIECRRRDGSIISVCDVPVPTEFVSYSDQFKDIVWYIIENHHMLADEFAKAS